MVEPSRARPTDADAQGDGSFGHIEFLPKEDAARLGLRVLCGIEMAEGVPEVVRLVIGVIGGGENEVRR